MKLKKLIQNFEYFILQLEDRRKGKFLYVSEPFELIVDDDDWKWCIGIDQVSRGYEWFCNQNS